MIFSHHHLHLSAIFANCLAGSEKTCKFPGYCLWIGALPVKIPQKESSVPVTPEIVGIEVVVPLQ